MDERVRAFIDEAETDHIIDTIYNKEIMKDELNDMQQGIEEETDSMLGAVNKTIEEEYERLVCSDCLEQCAILYYAKEEESPRNVFCLDCLNDSLINRLSSEIKNNQ